MTELAWAPDVEAWRRRPLAEKLGNIGSEVGRAIRAKTGGHPERLQPAFERALQLFDMTVEGVPSASLRELRRAREVVCDYLVGDNTFATSPQWLEAYFMAFATKHRRGR